MSPIVGPFASEAAVTIHFAYVGALAPHTQLLRDAHGAGERLVAARAPLVRRLGTGTIYSRLLSGKRSLDHSAMTESRHLFNSLLRIAARPIHHNAAIPIETRPGVRCRGRTDPDVHLADPVSNAAAE